MSMRVRLSIATLLCSFTAGCGLSGTYPSLAPRPEELSQTAAGPAACGTATSGGCGPSAAPQAPASPPAPALTTTDPTLKTQLDRLLSEAQGGETAFRSELPATERSVAAAGAAGSDSWAAAQVALSRLETARTPTAVAAAELDALARARVEAAPSATQADLDAINAAADQVRALVAGQDQAIERLGAGLASL